MQHKSSMFTGTYKNSASVTQSVAHAQCDVRAGV